MSEIPPFDPSAALIPVPEVETPIRAVELAEREEFAEKMAPPKKKGGRPKKGEKRKAVVVAPKKRGRPLHVPTPVARNQVLHFCGMGMTQPQIALLLGIGQSTLKKYYKDELAIGEAQMNVNVATNLYTIATSKDHKSAAQAAIFWMKARGRWRETNRMEHTGADGAPIQSQAVAPEVIDSSKLTPEHREALKEIIATAIANNSEQGEEPPEDEEDIEGEYEEGEFEDEESDEE